MNLNNNLKLTLLFCLIINLGYGQTNKIKLEPSKQHLVDSINNIINKTKKDSNYVKNIITLSGIYLNTNPELTIDYAKQALTLSKNIQWPIGYIKAYNTLASADYVKSDFINARTYSEKALQIEDSAGDINDKISTLETYSAILSKMNLVLDAIKATNKLITLTDKNYPAYKKFIMYANLSGLYLESQQYDLGLQKIVEAEKLIPYIKDSIACQASINLKKGNLYYYTNDSNNAIKYFVKSIYYYDRSLNNTNEVMACTNLASLYLDKKKFDSSILYLNKGYTIASSNHDSYGQNCLLTIKCKYYYTIRNYNAAMQCLIKTIPNIETTKDYGSLTFLYYIKFDIFNKLGQYKEALNAYTKYRDMSDSVFGADNEQQILLKSQETEYILKEKERKEIQDKKDLMAAQTLKTNKLELYGSIIVAFLLFIIILILYNRYKLSQESKKIIIHKSNELELKSKQLEELNQLKNKLFSIIAHDLRSPMMTLDATLKLFKFNNLTFETLNKFSGYLQNSVTETLNLLDNLLMWSYSQIESGRLVIESLNLKELAKENVQLYQQTADLKNISISLLMPDEIMAQTDKNIINLVIRNLLSNAIKFTPAGGQITVTAQKKDKSILLMIADTGKGIDPSIISKIFILDANKSQSGTNNETGTGLGLVLCNDLLQKMGGKISVVSKLGEGSTFFVELPLAD